ncbi:MAG: hypothetical protein IT323_03110 [Anaerolineae bacterium]|nr:hypothetical protein [Anaerolineae bacterium]
MKRKRKIIAVLAFMVISLLAVEGALAWLDPLGAYHYYADLRAVQGMFVADPARVFSIPPGVYPISDWSFTIDGPERTRATPGNAAGAACRLLVLGDSVTFGLGVDDAATWADHIAQARPDLHVVNAALPWYDVWAVARAAALPADWRIYLLIDNDADHTADAALQRLDRVSAIKLYARLVGVGQHTAGGENGDLAPPDDFWAALDGLLADPRLIVVGLRGTWLAEQVAASGRRITLIAPYTERLSWADAHPNAAGHRQIADQVLPLLPPEGMACARRN